MTWKEENLFAAYDDDDDWHIFAAQNVFNDLYGSVVVAVAVVVAAAVFENWVSVTRMISETFIFLTLDVAGKWFCVLLIVNEISSSQ